MILNTCTVTTALLTVWLFIRTISPCGQLEYEIKRHSWLVSNFDVSLIIDTPAEKIWDETMSRMGIDANNLITPDTIQVN